MKNRTKKEDCVNFEKYLPLVLKNKINIEDYAFFKKHMDECEDCREKYRVVKNILNDIKKIEKTYTTPPLIEKHTFTIKEYITISENLSAYIDKELQPEENLKVKKFLIGHRYYKKNYDELNKVIEYIKTGAEKYYKNIDFKERVRNFMILKIRKAIGC